MTSAPFPPVPAVDAQEAQRMAAQGAMLLDVREPDEWAAGHAPDATHVPLGQLAARLSTVPRDASVVAVCRSGGRSEQATRFLRQHGYDAANLDGGMRAWVRAGGRIVRDDGGPGRVA